MLGAPPRPLSQREDMNSSLCPFRGKDFLMSETLLAPSIDRHIATLNAEFALLSPRERIRLAYQLFGDQLVLATTFGPTAPVLLQQATETVPDIPVVSVRHGHETDMTLAHAEFYANHFDLNLKIYEPNEDAEPRPADVDASDFQWRAKIEPFGRALAEQGALAYISGAMDWQTSERPDWPFIERQHDGAVIAVRPLLDVTAGEVDHFFKETGLPRNTDYYDPTKGPDQKQECKLNTVAYVGHRVVGTMVDRSYITRTS